MKNDWRDVHSQKLTLGEDISVSYFNRLYLNCRFVKVTPKGFNILNLDTSRMILKRHLYMKGMAYKEYPKHGAIKGKFLISNNMTIVKKKNCQERVS